MAGRFGSGMMAGFIGLTLVMAGCGYDKPNSANDANSGNGSGYITAANVEARVTTASGDLTQALATFRGILGDSNTIPGDQGSGRREINWDAVPAVLTNVNTFPGDQFNRVVPRGQVFTTEGTGFRVSDNALADLNPGYASQFAAFSPTKIFIAAGSRALTVHFQVAGSPTAARRTPSAWSSPTWTSMADHVDVLRRSGADPQDRQRAGSFGRRRLLLRRRDLRFSYRREGPDRAGAEGDHRSQQGQQRRWRRRPGGHG